MIPNYLIENAKSGDNNAVEEILLALGPDIDSKCKRFYVDGFSHEDLVKVARQEVTLAIKEFDPNSYECVTFEDFALRVMVPRKLTSIVLAAKRS